MNPDKVYPVSPHQRAALIRKVIEKRELTSARDNIQVQGM
jgi:hypothetical protein